VLEAGEDAGLLPKYDGPVYWDEGAIGRQCAREMGQRQIEQAKRRGEWRGNDR